MPAASLLSWPALQAGGAVDSLPTQPGSSTQSKESPHPAHLTLPQPRQRQSPGRVFWPACMPPPPPPPVP